MLVLWLSLLFMETPGGEAVTVVQRFASPEETSDDFISFPGSMDFAANGRLYLMDRAKSRVLIWNKDGSYYKGFGREGEGPGELTGPLKLSVIEDEVWVWEVRQRMSIFDLDGNYKTTFLTTGLLPRTFLPITPDVAVYGVRQPNDKSKFDMIFHVGGRDGKHAELKRFQNDGLLMPMKGAGGNDTTVKAFMPEVDIQRDNQGRTWIGFSQNNKLFRMDKQGKIVEDISLELPNLEVTDADKEIVNAVSFALPNGGRVGFKQLPQMKLDYSHPKAHYTHFLINDDKILLVLTPIGTFAGVGVGYHQASYLVYDRKANRPVHRARYAFPEDTRVFYRNGRILACAINEEDEFEVLEINLRGM